MLISWLVILIMLIYLVFSAYYLIILLVELMKSILGYKSKSSTIENQPEFENEINIKNDKELTKEEKDFLEKLRA